MYVLTASVEGYCFSGTHFLTYTRYNSSGRGIGPWHRPFYLHGYDFIRLWNTQLRLFYSAEIRARLETASLEIEEVRARNVYPSGAVDSIQSALVITMKNADSAFHLRNENRFHILAR